MDRRNFLSLVGLGGFTIFAVGATGCADDAVPRPATSASPDASTSSSGPTSTSAGEPRPSTTAAPPSAAAYRWGRVALGSVSAYLLIRDAEAVVVDTGVRGSEDAIEAGLQALGTGWEAVGSVVLTHRHPDHVGSVPAVLERAATAAVFAGAADIADITSPVPITAVADGDVIRDLRIVATPGHTAGHICVFEPSLGLLLAGDALNGADAVRGVAGEVAGPNPTYTSDMATALESMRTLAELEPTTIVFGHGEPVVEDAALKLSELAGAS